jgi:N-acetyltransferase 10
MNLELKKLQESLKDSKIIGALIQQSKTLDQAKALLMLMDALTQENFKYTVSITAARGRGKSAAIGLMLAAALQLGLTNIFVTAPSPENLQTLFEFCFKGTNHLS